MDSDEESVSIDDFDISFVYMEGKPLSVELQEAEEAAMAELEELKKMKKLTEEKRKTELPLESCEEVKNIPSGINWKQTNKPSRMSTFPDNFWKSLWSLVVVGFLIISSILLIALASTYQMTRPQKLFAIGFVCLSVGGYITCCFWIVTGQNRSFFRLDSKSEA